MSYREFREAALDGDDKTGPIAQDEFAKRAGEIAVEYAQTAFLGGSSEWPTAVDIEAAIRLDRVRKNILVSTYRVALDVALQFSAEVPSLGWPDLGNDMELWVRDYAWSIESGVEWLRGLGLAK